MSVVLLGLLFGPPSAIPSIPPAEAPLRAAVACVMAAWNVYDVEASRACYRPDAVARNAHGVVPIDWEMETRLRAFDREARSRFGAEIRQVDGDTVEYRLHETNGFVTALGLEGVSGVWRYVVRDGRIAEEDLLEADASFRLRLRKFTEWGRTSRPAGWETVVDSEGIVRFDGATAPRLIALAREWQASLTPRPR